MQSTTLCPRMGLPASTKASSPSTPRCKSGLTTAGTPSPLFAMYILFQNLHCREAYRTTFILGIQTRAVLSKPLTVLAQSVLFTCRCFDRLQGISFFKDFIRRRALKRWQKVLDTPSRSTPRLTDLSRILPQRRQSSKWQLTLVCGRCMLTNS